MTSSIKWEPIEDLKAIRDLVDRTVIRPLASISLPGLGSFCTLLDMYETEGAYVAEVTVPGLEAEDLDISVSGSKLTVKGERKAPEETPTYLHRERPTGRLSRALRVPEDVDVSQIAAKLATGVLTVTMPKGQVAEAVEIEVTPKK
jgi:HSP20 family protein